MEHMHQAGLPRVSPSPRATPTRAPPWLPVPGFVASRTAFPRGAGPVLTCLPVHGSPVLLGPGVPRAPVPGSPLAPPSRAHPCTTYRDPCTPWHSSRAHPSPSVPGSSGPTRPALPRVSPSRAPPWLPYVQGSPRIPRHKLTRGPPSRANRWSALPGSAIAPRAGPPRCPPSRDHPCTGPGFPRGYPSRNPPCHGHGTSRAPPSRPAPSTPEPPSRARPWPPSRDPPNHRIPAGDRGTIPAGVPRAPSSRAPSLLRSGHLRGLASRAQVSPFRHPRDPSNYSSGVAPVPGSPALPVG